MGQKFFISFNSADQTKAHWIAWTLKEAGHEVAVHDWEIPDNIVRERSTPAQLAHVAERHRRPAGAWG
jgi:hypothetical protein